MSFRNAKGGYIRPGYDPLEVANPPTGAGASAGNQSASVSFTAPTNVGGSAITNYYAVSNPGQITASSVTSPISVSGLTNGTEYTFKVWGENSYGPSAYSAPTGAVTPLPPFIEDVFSTYLWTGDGSARTITNNIDLSGEGGMVWIKSRSSAFGNFINDTVRGATNNLLTNTTDAQFTNSQDLTAFTSSGFSVGTNNRVNDNGGTMASWTFRKAEKFFDVVTYTGDGTNNRAISHNLGSTPGVVIVKRTDSTGVWATYHRSLGTTSGYPNYLVLNSTNAQNSGDIVVFSAAPTSTTFTVGSSTSLNASGGTYVAYLFAHDAGGFGDSGSESVIKCGSFTTDGSGKATVSLGWEPQWVLVKRTTGGTGNWEIADNMRGWTVSGNAALYPNLSNAENNPDNYSVTATGFLANNGLTSSDFIYIAIRRGPMKTPETGSSVFEPFVDRTSIANKTNGTMGPVDMTMQTQVSDPLAGYHWTTFDRLRGANKYILTASTAAEATDTSVSFDVMGGVKNATWFSSGGVGYNFKRAPGFFDIVCYTGPGGGNSVTFSHNLGVAPELLIIKRRNSSGDWAVLSSILSGSNALFLNSTTAQFTGAFPPYYSSLTTTSVTLGGQSVVAGSGTYVAYLFATLAGISKVGSYTGTGTTQQINCGFTSGARFVIIKRINSTGDWYVWDSARGIVAGNDPYLLLNSTAAEVTNTDYVDTYSAGFEISSTAPAEINANGGTYLFLAIA